MNSWVTKFQNDFKNKKVVVTGASGFVGGHLCSALVEVGANVFALDQFISDQIVRLGIPTQQIDLTDLTQAKAIIVKIQPDIIFHLAAFVTARQDINLVLPMLQNNLIATVNVLLSAKETTCERVVLMGSAEDGNLKGDSPTSPYAASKSAANLYGKLFADIYGLPVVTIRLFMAYGPGQNEEKIIPYSILSLLQDKFPEISSPEREVDFIYILDVIHGLLLAGIRPNIANKVFELGTGNVLKIKDVVEMIAKILQKDIDPLSSPSITKRHCEKNLKLTSDSAQNILGWQPNWSLQDGLTETIAWYRMQMEQYNEV